MKYNRESFHHFLIDIFYQNFNWSGRTGNNCKINIRNRTEMYESCVLIRNIVNVIQVSTHYNLYDAQAPNNTIST